MKRLLVLLLALFCASTAQAQNLKVDATSGAVNAFDALDRDTQLAVRLSTQVTGVATQLQAAVDYACTHGSKTLWVPGGTWPLERGISICSGLQIVCSLGQYRSQARFYPTQDALAWSNNATVRDGLFYGGAVGTTTFQGCHVDGNAKYVDGFRHDSATWFAIRDNVFDGFRGVVSWRISAVNTGTDTFTTSSTSGNTDILNVGLPIICQTADLGGVLPTGVTANTRYWVRSKISSREFTFSTTPGGGGSAVNITGTGSDDFYCLTGVIPFTSSAFDIATDTVTLASHGFQIGQKLEFCEGNALPEIVSGQFYDAPMWILSSGFTANTFQLSTTPGGTPLDWTNAGGAGTKKICLSYGAIRVGASLYCDVSSNRISNGMVSMTPGEGFGPFSGNAAYGCNVITFTKNQMNADVRILGACFADHNSFESATSYPLQAKMHVSQCVVTANYWELIARALNGHAITTASVIGQGSGSFRDNIAFGPDSAPGSFGIYVSAPHYTQITGNNWNSFSQAYSIAAYPNNSGTDSVIGGDRINLCAASGLFGPRTLTVGAGPSGLLEWSDSLLGYRWLGNGGTVLQDRSATTQTTLDLALGNYWVITPAANERIATVTNGNLRGGFGCIAYAADGVLGSTAFITPSGADLQMHAGETVCFDHTASGPRIRAKPGDVVDTRTLSLTAQVSGATNIFSGNVTAGQYEVEVAGYVDTAGTGGTYDVEIAATDAIGARTVTAITGVSLASQTRSTGNKVTLRTNGSSNITYRVPWTGATGSPTLTLVLTTRRTR